MTLESACLAGRNNIKKRNVIRSHCHVIYTEIINKIALSSYDDKRVIIADEIHTLAYGHTNLKNYNELPNILVDSVVLLNKPLSNLEIIDVAKRLSLYEFRGVFFARHSFNKNKIKRMWYFKFRFIFW